MILGGGYTGMWTAWFLKEREPALDVVLLERDICGGGPSGRNGGFVNGLYDELPTCCSSATGTTRRSAICRDGDEIVDEIGAWCEDARRRRLVRRGRRPRRRRANPAYDAWADR